MAGGARGWLRVGQAFGVLLLPGLGSAAPAPRFLGTQPPCATQALKLVIYTFTTSMHCAQHNHDFSILNQNKIKSGNDVPPLYLNQIVEKFW